MNTETPTDQTTAAEDAERPTVERIVMPDTRRTKGQIRKHKKSVGYENDVARCGTCVSYNPHWNGDKTIVGSWCKRNKFYCNTNGCCDLWESKSGETLKA